MCSLLYCILGSFLHSWACSWGRVGEGVLRVGLRVPEAGENQPFSSRVTNPQDLKPDDLRWADVIIIELSESRSVMSDALRPHGL